MSSKRKSLPGPDDLIAIHTAQHEVTSSPASHDLIELALAVTLTEPIAISLIAPPVWLIFVGPPSGDKTATASRISKMGHVYSLDSMTENVFNSGYVDPEGKPAEQLLDKINGKCVFFKDLTTLFSLRDDVVKRILGDLNSIYDGEFIRATGTIGTIRTKPRFSVVGCITSLALKRHQTHLSTIGTRFLFYRIPGLSTEMEREGFDILWDGGEKRKNAMEALTRRVTDYGNELNDILKSKKVQFAPEQRRHKDQIERMARLIVRSRGVISGSVHHDEAGKRVYERAEEVQVEHPFRAIQQLRVLGRALALVHTRLVITDHEVEMLRRVVLSSVTKDREKVLRLFQDQNNLDGEGNLKEKLCSERTGMCESWSRGMLRELEILGILEKSSGGYIPKDEFKELLRTPVEPLDHLLNLAPDDATQLSPVGSTQLPP
jgi:hypothetical protein